MNSKELKLHRQVRRAFDAGLPAVYTASPPPPLPPREPTQEEIDEDAARPDRLVRLLFTPSEVAETAAKAQAEFLKALGMRYHDGSAGWTPTHPALMQWWGRYVTPDALSQEQC